MENTRLELFIRDLNTGLENLEDLKLFEKVISDSLAVFSLTELLLSEELKTSRPTINRWKTGNTVPHILIREGVYKTLLKRARSLSKSLNTGSNSEKIKAGNPSGKVAHP